ncbi:MAG: hypothetical protein KGH94_04095 [Candidatus Micrarchaeota archaeon]|nr:hypothetical protein [Candidatus Micrarchaeota archaeon]
MGGNGVATFEARGPKRVPVYNGVLSESGQVDWREFIRVQVPPERHTHQISTIKEAIRTFRETENSFRDSIRNHPTIRAITKSLDRLQGVSMQECGLIEAGWPKAVVMDIDKSMKESNIYFQGPVPLSVAANLQERVIENADRFGFVNAAPIGRLGTMVLLRFDQQMSGSVTATINVKLELV